MDSPISISRASLPHRLPQQIASCVTSARIVGRFRNTDALVRTLPTGGKMCKP